MPHQILPLGKWRKEVSWNDPEVMFAPDGGHSNNQITPEDYVLEREMEGHDTILNTETTDPTKIGKIDPKKFVNKLKSVMDDSYYNLDYEQKLQLLASEKPSLGGFFNMGASMELDEMIRAAKANGQLDVNNNFHQPVAGSQIQVGQQVSNDPIASMNRFMSTMDTASLNPPQPQQPMPQQQRPIQQQAAPQPQLQRVAPKPTIKASRDQLKNLIAQKQQSSNTARNPYANKQGMQKKGR